MGKKIFLKKEIEETRKNFREKKFLFDYFFFLCIYKKCKYKTYKSVSNLPNIYLHVDYCLFHTRKFPIEERIVSQMDLEIC